MTNALRSIAAALLIATAAFRASAAEGYAADYQPEPLQLPAPAEENYFAPQPQPWWTLQGGVEATYLSLELRSLEDANVFETPLEFGFEAAPRIWLQAENPNGWGGQVRYWQYDAEAILHTTVIDVITAGIFATIDVNQAASAELYTVDAEVTRALELGDSYFTATVGGRHGGIAADNAVGLVVTSGPSLFDAATIHRNDAFHGSGLTASLAGIRPLGGSGWSLFGSLRGSALWGHEHRAAQSSLIAGGVAASNSDLVVDESAQLGILEVQAGAQWEHDLAWNRGLVFARLAFEYQNWNTTADTAPAALDGPSLLDADLYGISLAFGIER